MICYKDRTFCGSDVEKHTCGREITKEELDHAKKLGLPIAYGLFCTDRFEIKNAAAPTNGDDDGNQPGNSVEQKPDGITDGESGGQTTQ